MLSTCLPDVEGCLPNIDRKECRCMLLLTLENDFAGKEHVIFLHH